MNKKNFLDLVQQALPIAQEPIWLDHIFHNTYLVTFERALGLFLLAHKPSAPRELAVQLAIRQIEADAYAAFVSGLQKRYQEKSLQSLTPAKGVH